MAIQYDRITLADGRVVYRGYDTTTGKYVTPDLKDTFATIREHQVNQLGAYSQAQINQTTDRLYRRQGAIDQEILEYIQRGTLPHSAETRDMLTSIQLNYPPSAGWVMEHGVNVSDMRRFVGRIGCIVRNTKTGEVRLVDTNRPTKNIFLNNTHMNMLKRMYEQSHPGEHVAGIHQYDARNFRLTTGTPSPKGLLDVYGVRQGIIPRPVNLDQDLLNQAHRDSSNGFFIKGRKGTQYSGVHTTFDIETDDAGRPINIVAKKFGFNKENEIRLLDTFERYYKMSPGGNVQSGAVHNFTPSIIKKLQKEVGQKVGTVWNDKEKQDLLQFFEGEIVGHNIEGFDLPHLFTYEEREQLRKKHGILDTLQLARNYRQGAKNDLQSMFTEYLGRSTQAFGITSHWAGGDVTANELLFLEMLKGNNEMSRLGNAVLFHGGSSPLSIYFAEAGRSMDSYTGDIVYSAQTGRAYTLEEAVLMMQRLGNGGGQGMGSGGGINQNIVGALQDVADQLKVFQTSMHQATSAMQYSYQGAQQTFADLSSTIAATQSTRVGQIANQAFRNFPGANQGKMREAFIQASGLRGVSLQSAMKQMHLLEEAKIPSTNSLRMNEINASFAEDYKSVLETRKEYTDSLEREEKALKAARTERMRKLGPGLIDGGTSLIAGPGGSYSQVYNALGHAMGDVAHSVSWMPVFGKMAGRVSASYNNMLDMLAARADENYAWAKTIGGAMGSIGKGVGGIGGALIAGGGTLLEGAIGGGWKREREKVEISERFMPLAASFNLFGALVEGASDALRLFRNGLHIGANLFARFNKIMSYLNGMGLPFTNLTGVNYASYVGTTVADAGLGLKAGSINSSMNSWASAQQMLYTMGQVDVNRLVASSMLGVFTDVYANGGNTQEQYSAAMDKIARNMNGSNSQRYMALASLLSPTAQSELEMMKRLGVSHSTLTNGGSWFRYWNPLSEGEANSGYRTRLGYSAAGQQFSASMQRIGIGLWNSGGSDIAASLLQSLDSVALYIKNGEWGQAMQELKTQLKNIVGNVKQKLGIQGEGWDGMGNAMRNLFNKLAVWAKPGIEALGDAFNQFIIFAGARIGDLLNWISKIRIDHDVLMDTLMGRDTSGRKLISFAGDPLTDEEREDLLNGSSWDRISQGGRASKEAFTYASTGIAVLTKAASKLGYGKEGDLQEKFASKLALLNAEDQEDAYLHMMKDYEKYGAGAAKYMAQDILANHEGVISQISKGTGDFNGHSFLEVLQKIAANDAISYIQDAIGGLTQILSEHKLNIKIEVGDTREGASGSGMSVYSNVDGMQNVLTTRTVGNTITMTSSIQ